MDTDKTATRGEHRLLDKLLSTGYDQRERPVKTPNQTVEIDISLSVGLVLDMVRKQLFSSFYSLYI